MADNKNQMRPIARNLKAPPPPRFVQQSQNNQMQIDSKISAAFKTNVLAFQSVHRIRISHFENGPYLFYVQLEALVHEFQQMAARLLHMPRSHRVKAAVGTACLALYDEKVYRVVITKVPQHTQEDITINFVDFGFSRSIKLENLFHIPKEFLDYNTFAIPFSIAGCKATSFKVNDKEIDFYFRYLVEKQLLTLKCVPSDAPPFCQYCELLIDNKVNVLDKLKRWDPYEGLKFRPQNDLEMKVVHDVKVSYVDSAQEFYIHLQKPEIIFDYDKTCDELFKVMSRSPVHRNPKPGSCCAVYLGGDYYRGIVVGATKNKQTVQVKIVDFGIVEEIPEKHVHLLTEKFIERPPQAYRACLSGFESQEVSENISTQFEIFCGDGRGERKVFKMVIQEKLKDHYLVELEDDSVNPTVNVNKLLLKNSRPLIETIQLENAKKRHKDSRNFTESVEVNQDGNGAQRSKVNNTKGSQRNAPSTTNNGESKQSRTHSGKSRNEENAVAGTYYKSSKEASVWGSKESTPSDHNSVKSSDWEQPKNINREQNSSATWNESNDAHRNQKGKNSSKGSKQKAYGYEKKKTGWVSTFLSINRAFVHYDEHVEGLRQILDEMHAFYEKKNLPKVNFKDIQKGKEFAVRSKDGNWYRSKIFSTNGDFVGVLHREYGNTEVVRSHKLRVLDGKFARIGDLAVEAFFPVKPSPEFEGSLFDEMIKIFDNGAQHFSFKVIEKFNDGWILEPIDPSNNKNVIDELVKAKKAIRVSSNELQQMIEDELDPWKKERDAAEKLKNEQKSEALEVISTVKEAKPKKEQKSEVKSEVEAVQAVKEVKPRKAKKEKSPAKEKIFRATKEKSQEPKTDRIAVKMTALTSPTDFYISKVDEIPNFVKLHADIQIIATGAAPLEEFEEGTLCLAQQPFDLCWYRAKIIDSDETEQHAMITVRCMDDGKTFSVDDKSFLKIMPTALESKKFFGVACSLPVKIERKCEEEATDLMMAMMEVQLQASFITENESKRFVELFNDSSNVSDILVERKFAHRLEIITPGRGYTSHINSLSSFYLQFEMDQLKLDLISKYFEDTNGNFDSIEAKKGMIVAALFPDDECWYRARIESIEGDGYSVTFIDYGNTCQVKQIGKNSETAIWDLPAMSRHCCLAKPKSFKGFSEEAEAKFIEICANGATILDVKSSPVDAGAAAEVDLSLNGKNILDELLPLCNGMSDGIMDRTIDSTDMENLMSQHE